MTLIFFPFRPQPTPDAIPPHFPDPFAEVAPAELAQRAADLVQSDLRQGWLAPGLSAAGLEGPQGGKMFGVLVVRGPAGEIGYLKGFSGLLEGRWDVEGFVPPLFDRQARAALEIPGEARLKRWMRQAAALERSPAYRELRHQAACLEQDQAAQRAELAVRHSRNRQARKTRRSQLEQPGTTAVPHSLDAPAGSHSLDAPAGSHQSVPQFPPAAAVLRAPALVRPPEFIPDPDPGQARGEERAAERACQPASRKAIRADSKPCAAEVPPAMSRADLAEVPPAMSQAVLAEELHRLDQLSRADKAEKRRLEAEHQQARLTLDRQIQGFRRLIRALRELCRRYAQRLMRGLHETYWLTNARGDRVSLPSLFPGAQPPTGAGDCAAPKLLAAAYAQGWQPLALAEFWWGAAPQTGNRRSGVFYPACKPKCGPLLPFLLQGLEVQRRPRPQAAHRLDLPILFEDDWLLLVQKPAGLLSVPGKDENQPDSVLQRLQALYPEATGPILVHRLDRETSGLLLGTKQLSTYRALQRQFTGRTVQKRYIAWVEGLLSADSGSIDLALRVDLDDRPRQIHDPVHGKPALTEWQALGRESGRTRVAFFPRTGRTHQLRVHAAHPAGLNAPIVGDRLYGRPDTRLLLHAESLGFTHPQTGHPLTFENPAPF